MKEEINTKERLINKAIELFGKYGVGNVSVRKLAAEANVNICSVSYYFSGKEGLLDACINYIIESSVQKYFPLREQLSFMLTSDCKDLILWENFLKKYLRAIINSVMEEQYRNRFFLFLREHFSESKYGDMYFKKVMNPIKEDIFNIAKILNPNDDKEKLEIKVINIFAMTNFMFTAKNFTSKSKAEKYLNEKFLSKYIDYIIETIKI